MAQTVTSNLLTQVHNRRAIHEFVIGLIRIKGIERLKPMREVHFLTVTFFSDIQKTAQGKELPSTTPSSPGLAVVADRQEKLPLQ
jgi:hypothetical protein